MMNLRAKCAIEFAKAMLSSPAWRMATPKDIAQHSLDVADEVVSLLDERSLLRDEEYPRVGGGAG